MRTSRASVRADGSTRTRLHYGARNDSGLVVLFRYRNVTREQWVYDFFERRRPWRESYHHARPPSPAVHIGGGSALRQWGVLGFRFLTYRIEPGDYTEGAWAAVLPRWFLVLITAWLPGAWFVKSAKRMRDRRRQRQRLRGRCIACGYHVRASRKRCPECGSAIPSGAVVRDQLDAS